jgi:DNA-binding XRE family transcriptional regulator
MLHNRVKELREAHRLSQEQLAERSGVSMRLVTQLENEPGYTPQMRVAVALCRYFDVEIGDLFWIEGIGAAKPDPVAV